MMAAPSHLRVLVVGKGAREYALAWKLSQLPSVDHVYVAPGNGGTARGLPKVSNLGEVENQYEVLVTIARDLRVGLVVVGPESAIFGGIEGHLRHACIPCFAPTQEAADIEGSKVYAKDFMAKYHIPTAEYRSFDDFHAASDYVRQVRHKIVIKADGLAAGKGVVLPDSPDKAVQSLQDIMVNGLFGAAGRSVVIEEFLEGQEVSILTLSDGRTTINLPVGQDHKRIDDGDPGLNTGGMGVYAPVPAATPTVLARIEQEILQPTFEGLRQEGREFVELLFTGIMLTPTGPKVLEYNARFGDPETQSVLSLLSPEVDLAQLMMACIHKTLHQVDIATSPEFACNVVVAAGGYPEEFRQGDMVTLTPPPDGCLIFHAGTKLVGDQILTAGGRVFTVVGKGITIQEAVDKAYLGVRSIDFPRMHYRRDIAHRALSCT